MVTEIQLDQMTIEQKLQLVDELWLSMTPELVVTRKLRNKYES